MLDTNPSNAKNISILFFDFVKKYKLENQLKNIVKYLLQEQLVRKKNNTLKIYSPFPLPLHTVSLLEKHMDTTENTETNVILEPQLLGGFRAYYQDTKVDASIQSTLEKLRKNLLLTENNLSS